jgi:Icc-related predicted phosphoesterase
MKILFTSDLHGEEILYHQVLGQAKEGRAEVLILGGDLLPTLQKARRYEEMVAEQKAFIDVFLLPFFREGLARQFRRILLIPGNWDPAYPEIFKAPFEGLVDLDRKKFRFEDGYEFIGYPFVPPTPFRPKDYEKMDDPESPWPPQRSPSYILSSQPPYDLVPIDPAPYLRGKGTIAKDLEELPAPANLGKAIYVMHSPPFGTSLDVIPGGHFVGSRSIRKFIEACQPLLTLHGHIHEAPHLSGNFTERIGRTICVNPGQLLSADEGGPRLQGVVFDLEDLGSIRKTEGPLP